MFRSMALLTPVLIASLLAGCAKEQSSAAAAIPLSIAAKQWVSTATLPTLAPHFEGSSKSNFLWFQSICVK